MVSYVGSRMQPALLMLFCPVCCERVIGFEANCSLLILLWKIRPIWNPSKSGSYSCVETLEAIREKKYKVSWWRSTWYSKAILKHACLHWLAGHVE